MTRKQPRLVKTTSIVREFSWNSPDGKYWVISYLTPFRSVGLQLYLAQRVAKNGRELREAVDLVQEEVDHSTFDERLIEILHDAAVDDYDAYVAGDQKLEKV